MFSYTLLGGEKKKWLIAFYGYGQSVKAYEPLYDLIYNEYNLLVIDYPKGDYKTDIYPTDLASYCTKLFIQFDIQEMDVISYSMGSRLGLYIPYFFPEKVKQLILIAPDGIEIAFWNKVGVHTSIGQWLFNFFVNSKNAYQNLLNILYNLGIMNKSLYAFSKWNMRDVKQRTYVYNAWMNLRKMEPNLKLVNKKCEEYGIRLISYFGSLDPVIPKQIFKQCKKAFPKGEHHILTMDHQILNKEFFTLLAKKHL